MSNIRTYPDLNFIFLKQRLALPARLWYLLRAADGQGSGRLERGYAEVMISDVLSKGQFRRALNAGKGVFWELRPRKGGGQWIVMRGLATVCWDLGMERIYRNPVLLPRAAFGKVGEFRAYLYASWHAREKPNPIGHATLKRLCGGAPSTHVRWAKVANIQSETNILLTGVLTRDIHLEDYIEEGYYATVVNGRPQMCKRLPNTYFADLETTSKGRMKKANQRLHARRIGAGLSNQKVRLYFRTPKALLKAKNKSDDALLHIGKDEERALWAYGI